MSRYRIKKPIILAELIAEGLDTCAFTTIEQAIRDGFNLNAPYLKSPYVHEWIEKQLDSRAIWEFLIRQGYAEERKSQLCLGSLSYNRGKRLHVYLYEEEAGIRVEGSTLIEIDLERKGAWKIPGVPKEVQERTGLLFNSRGQLVFRA